MKSRKKILSVLFRESTMLVILILLSSSVWVLGDTSASPPIKVDRLTVVIIEETESRGSIPQEQLNAINSKKWREYVSENKGQWRVIDQHARISDEKKWVKDAIKLKRSSLPWLIVSRPSHGSSSKFPENLEKLMEKIKQ